MRTARAGLWRFLEAAAVEVASVDSSCAKKTFEYGTTRQRHRGFFVLPTVKRAVIGSHDQRIEARLPGRELSLSKDLCRYRDEIETAE